VTPPAKRIAQPTVRRLSLYLRFLEEAHERGLATVSSQELARLGGTSSAQVRKDLSVFGSFGKRGLGYTVAELITALRAILGLGREWRVVIVGAGKIGSALAQYAGFRQRGFSVVAVYDNDEPNSIGYTFSEDGIHWSAGQHLLVQDGKGVWASEVRTPLGLIPEDKNSFTLFYTANERVSGMQADGNGINTTPGSMGLVEVRLKKLNTASARKWRPS